MNFIYRFMTNFAKFFQRTGNRTTVSGHSRIKPLYTLKGEPSQALSSQMPSQESQPTTTGVPPIGVYGLETNQCGPQWGTFFGSSLVAQWLFLVVIGVVTFINLIALTYSFL